MFFSRKEIKNKLFIFFTIVYIALTITACKEILNPISGKIILNHGEYGDFKYIAISYNSVGIADYIGTNTNVDIPSSIRGNSVTRIGNIAFNEKGITDVIIPRSITEIGLSAFANNQLTSVTIPNSVIAIGKDSGKWNNYYGVGAFANNQLTSVIIPNSVTTIGSGAFRGNQLISVTIGDNVVFGGDYDGNTGGFGGNFRQVYGGVGGTFTRPTPESEVWTRMP